ATGDRSTARLVFLSAGWCGEGRVSVPPPIVLPVSVNIKVGVKRPWPPEKSPTNTTSPESLSGGPFADNDLGPTLVNVRPAMVWPGWASTVLGVKMPEPPRKEA